MKTIKANKLLVRRNKNLSPHYTIVDSRWILPDKELLDKDGYYIDNLKSYYNESIYLLDKYRIKYKINRGNLYISLSSLEIVS